MRSLGTYYGTTLLQEKDSKGTNNKNKIELEYYKIKKHGFTLSKKKTFYGIAVVKKEYIEDKIKMEKNVINKITTNERTIVNIIEKLKKCKVTPIALDDVLTDLMKQTG